MQPQTTPSDDRIAAIDVLTQAEFQEQQATLLQQAVFGDADNAQRTGELITRFVRSYEQHKRDMPLNLWLIQEFRLYPTIWATEAELESTAREVIQTVEANNAAKASLYAHLDKGKSRESWLAKNIEDGAKAAGVTNVGAYASQIDTALQQANRDMQRTMTTNAGVPSLNPNLDGFIAEQHHVDTFNIDAAAKGSGYRAKALVPDGTTYGENSMDIGIYDDNGKLVKRYQVKYGKDADSTGKLFEKGDYRGQRKLVPADQVEQLENATDTIEIGDVKSKPLSKAEAKALQEKVQREAEAKQYDWNDASRIDIAKNIGKQALIGAALNAGMQGARIIGRRTWNWLTGKGNPPASEDLKEFFESSVKSAANVGVQVAVSGAIVVAVKSGWLGKVLKNTPVGRVVNAAYAGMENAKILYKYAKGELSGTEALDAMGTTTSSMVGSLAAAAAGAELGATIGTALGPVGTVVGGLVGGVVGGMAGSKIGQAVYEGGKAIVSTAVSVVKSVATTVSNAVSAVASKVGGFFSKIFG